MVEGAQLGVFVDQQPANGIEPSRLVCFYDPARNGGLFPYGAFEFLQTLQNRLAAVGQSIETGQITVMSEPALR